MPEAGALEAKPLDTGTLGNAKPDDSAPIGKLDAEAYEAYEAYEAAELADGNAIDRHCDGHANPEGRENAFSTSHPCLRRAYAISSAGERCACPLTGTLKEPFTCGLEGVGTANAPVAIMASSTAEVA